VKAGWGKTYPVEFYEGGDKVAQKWYTWTSTNDLAGKAWMRDGLYLVRCSICKTEARNKVATWICPKEDCREAAAIILELNGGQMLFDDELDTWFTSERDEVLDANAQAWWEDTAESNEQGA